MQLQAKITKFTFGLSDPVQQVLLDDKSKPFTELQKSRPLQRYHSIMVVSY